MKMIAPPPRTPRPYSDVLRAREAPRTWFILQLALTRVVGAVPPRFEEIATLCYRVDGGIMWWNL